MGKKDISEKNLEQYADVFSDIINALLYAGKHVVKEKKLYPAATVQSVQEFENNM